MNLDGARRAPADWYGFKDRPERPHDDQNAGHLVIITPDGRQTLAGTYCPTMSGSLLRARLGIRRDES